MMRSSLRMSGGLGVGQGITADDGTDALLVLNSMLSSWNINGIRVPSQSRDLYTLIANKTTPYTIGAGGDWNATRPNKIFDAGFVQNGSNIEWPVKVMQLQEWAGVRLKTLASSFPYAVYNDGGYPLSSLTFYPTPNTTDKIALYTWDFLTQYTSTATAMVVPDGYTDAIRYNLAVRIAVEWGRALNNTEEVKRLARESLAAIENLNSPDYVMECDPALTGASGNGDAWYGIWQGVAYR